MNRNTVILIFVILGFVILGFFLNKFLSNNSQSFEIKIGFTGHQTEKSVSCRFIYFTGRKKLYINATGNEKIKISYDISLKNGEILIYLVSPEGKEVWKHKVNRKAKENEIVRLKIPGIYTLEIDAKGARSGKIELYWERILGI
ncbi:MAG: hypothetical protein J7L34_05800 [Thermotogaceae bacterium]|nr:hypothetical protein [Thermotogaceae bacterium]